MVAPVGPPATRNCEPRQARKGATVAMDVCAGMWLAGAIAFSGILYEALPSADSLTSSTSPLTIHYMSRDSAHPCLASAFVQEYLI